MINFIKAPPSENMFMFSDIIEIQGENGSVTEKTNFDGKGGCENINATRSEVIYFS